MFFTRCVDSFATQKRREQLGFNEKNPWSKEKEEQKQIADTMADAMGSQTQGGSADRRDE